ncbi:pyridoxamine 5'-phosphate oxidase family protein [Nocardioides sp.]|uniref:pyridoxamine 5'-phosphate oxidase family protein n=1 Tax=Nocardioides sp. TaxID=35761 RepID=UPI003564F8EF
MTQTPSGDARMVQMTPYECWQQLDGDNQIARVVWAGQDGPAIIPVNYAVSDGALWFQISHDSELGRGGTGQRVLVEVDHADPASHAGWSVVITGTAAFIDAVEAPDILRDLRVWPSGPRSVCVRVDPDEVSGRRLMPRR